MSYNSFDYYRQLRQYQLHLQKLTNPETNVPTHSAFKPQKPQYQKARQYKKNKELEEIQHQNAHIMKKLVNINRRKPQNSKSSPNLSLPKIKKQFNIPLYQQQNNQIARRIIESKPVISTKKGAQRYNSLQTRKRLISKYYNQDGTIINRKKYIAELMILKKMRVSEVLKNK